MPSHLARSALRADAAARSIRIDAFGQRHQGSGKRIAPAHVGSDPAGRRAALRPESRRTLRTDVRQGSRPRRADRAWSSPRPTPRLRRTVQSAFSGPTFRLYTNPDPIGVEIGGAVKNVVAIGAGVCHGLGLGQQRHRGIDYKRVGRDHPARRRPWEASRRRWRDWRAWAIWS